MREPYTIVSQSGNKHLHYWWHTETKERVWGLADDAITGYQGEGGQIHVHDDAHRRQHIADSNAQGTQQHRATEIEAEIEEIKIEQTKIEIDPETDIANASTPRNGTTMAAASTPGGGARDTAADSVREISGDERRPRTAQDQLRGGDETRARGAGISHCPGTEVGTAAATGGGEDSEGSPRGAAHMRDETARADDGYHT